VAVRFLARWVRLFRREPLRRWSIGGIRDILSEREIRPLSGAFIGEVTEFVGSARWEVSINIGGSSDYYNFYIPPFHHSCSPALPCVPATHHTLEWRDP